jgi:F-type H+-transporting ATPase subunit gamma
MNELRERGELLGELQQIVQAMKNLAFAELQRVARVRAAQAQARDAVRHALATLGGSVEAATSRPRAWLVIGAERGLCGAFNAQLVQEVSDLRRNSPQARLFVASRRLRGLLPADIAAEGLPGCPGLEDADDVLDAWVQRVAHEVTRGAQAWVLHAVEGGCARQRLWPPDPRVGNQSADHLVPLHYLSIPVLRSALERQLLRLVLQAGLVASLQQENRWRLAQMQRAQDHLEELGSLLRSRVARIRQADITNELETLISSLSAAGPNALKPGF